jgi:hypothetical protein
VFTVLTVFLTSMSVMALVYGRSRDSFETHVTSAVFGALLMTPCRLVLPRLFKVANMFPAIPRWGRPSFATVVLQYVKTKKRVWSRASNWLDFGVKPKTVSNEVTTLNPARTVWTRFEHKDVTRSTPERKKRVCDPQRLGSSNGYPGQPRTFMSRAFNDPFYIANSEEEDCNVLDSPLRDDKRVRTMGEATDVTL